MTSRTYRVDLGTRAYDIHIEAGCMARLGEAVRRLLPDAGRCLVVSNDVVAPLYLERATASLKAAGWEVRTHVLPDGERHKNAETWLGILDALMETRLGRDEPVVALGGGVVGDMVGFAASTYRRGIPFVQVPTTLLAQVDSSVGGKTAINHPRGKNMIGAFYQPRLVWIDPDVLTTLPDRELRAGLAEVIKYGLIRDAAFASELGARMARLLACDGDALADVIHASCRHKAEVVMRDETERGERALLNLGHTFGHAIEAMTRYTRYLHGEAVAIGTRMAARLSERRGDAPAGLECEVLALYEAAGLPTEVPEFDADAWLAAMGHDKKNVGRRIRYVLLRGVGDAFLAENVSDAEVRGLVESFAAGAD